MLGFLQFPVAAPTLGPRPEEEPVRWPKRWELSHLRSSGPFLALGQGKGAQQLCNTKHGR